MRSVIEVLEETCFWCITLLQCSGNCYAVMKGNLRLKNAGLKFARDVTTK